MMSTCNIPLDGKLNLIFRTSKKRVAWSWMLLLLKCGNTPPVFRLAKALHKRMASPKWRILGFFPAITFGETLFELFSGAQKTRYQRRDPANFVKKLHYGVFLPFQMFEKISVKGSPNAGCVVHGLRKTGQEPTPGNFCSIWLSLRPERQRWSLLASLK